MRERVRDRNIIAQAGTETDRPADRRKETSTDRQTDKDRDKYRQT